MTFYYTRVGFGEANPTKNIPRSGAVSANVALVALTLESVLVGDVRKAAIGVVPSGIKTSSSACDSPAAA